MQTANTSVVLDFSSANGVVLGEESTPQRAGLDSASKEIRAAILAKDARCNWEADMMVSKVLPLIDCDLSNSANVQKLVGPMCNLAQRINYIGDEPMNAFLSFAKTRGGMLPIDEVSLVLTERGSRFIEGNLELAKDVASLKLCPDQHLKLLKAVLSSKQTSSHTTGSMIESSLSMLSARKEADGNNFKVDGTLLDATIKALAVISEDSQRAVSWVLSACHNVEGDYRKSTARLLPAEQIAKYLDGTVKYKNAFADALWTASELARPGNILTPHTNYEQSTRDFTPYCCKTN